MLRIARHLGIHTTTLSQILKGDWHLSMERAGKISDYFGLSDLETRFLLLLVQLDRASSVSFKNILNKQIEDILRQSTELAHILTRDKVLAQEEKTVFYSNWYYSATRVLSSIPNYQTPESIAKYLRLPRNKTNEVIEFLVSVGLCVEQNGRIEPGPKYTHLEASSPFVARHHSNWRVKAMERHPVLAADELCYTLPMSLSREDAKKIRDLLVELVEKVSLIRAPSACEKSYCLNFDWFKF